MKCRVCNSNIELGGVLLMFKWEEKIFVDGLPGRVPTGYRIGRRSL